MIVFATNAKMCERSRQLTSAQRLIEDLIALQHFDAIRYAAHLQRLVVGVIELQEAQCGRQRAGWDGLVEDSVYEVVLVYGPRVTAVMLLPPSTSLLELLLPDLIMPILLNPSSGSAIIICLARATVRSSPSDRATSEGGNTDSPVALSTNGSSQSADRHIRRMRMW